MEQPSAIVGKRSAKDPKKKLTRKIPTMLNVKTFLRGRVLGTTVEKERERGKNCNKVRVS